MLVLESEVVELRDGGDSWMGKGVETALENINRLLAPNLLENLSLNNDF